MSGETPGPPAEPELDKTQLIKLAIDLGPLLVFFVVLLTKGIYPATGALMVLSVVAIILSRVLLGHVSKALLVTTVLVLGFGTMTIVLADPRWIKLKPTIVNLLFAAVILAGVAVGKPLLRLIMGEALQLTDAGWRQLSIRCGVFFLAMAGLNEIVWRNYSDQVWGGFKVALFPITLVFFALQMGLIQRHRITAPDAPKSAP